MLSIKNKNKLISITYIFFICLLILPLITKAELVKCSLSTTTGIVGNNAVGGGCDFTDLIRLINDIINWIISIAGIIFTISAIYGGFLYITSGENPGNKAKAKSILWSTVIGFVIILVSWLIVYTILDNLTVGSEYRTSVFKFIGGGN